VRPWLIPLWILVEALAGLVVFVLCLATPFMNALLGRAARGDRPLLLVHGFGMVSGCMLVVGWRFARTGHRPVAVGFSSLRDLEHAAEKLAGRAAALALHTGAARVDVVAHSVGGLVARTARAVPGGAAIGRIVTLGTPHRGEWWHAMPIGPLRLAMRAGRFGIGEADDLAITSRADLIIRWSRATLDPPSRTLILDAAGHAGLLLDARAHRAAIAHLAPPALLAAPR
jgi:pimeloyl-ACP methyl ester carboxylesterase